VKDRICYLVLATAAILSLALISLARDEKADFSIVISAPQSVKAGAVIVVNITMTNITDHRILFLGSAAQNNNFHVDVFDSKGELAPRTWHGRAVRGELQQGSGHIITEGHSGLVYMYLTPGETHKESSLISPLFDLKPGMYTVQAWRPDFHETDPPTVNSSPEDSDLRKSVGTHPSPAANPPPAKPKAIARSNTITIAVIP
jgi:hypothetical protein